VHDAYKISFPTTISANIVTEQVIKNMQYQKFIGLIFNFINTKLKNNPNISKEIQNFIFVSLLNLKEKENIIEQNNQDIILNDIFVIIGNILPSIQELNTFERIMKHIPIFLKEQEIPNLQKLIVKINNQYQILGLNLIDLENIDYEEGIDIIFNYYKKEDCLSKIVNYLKYQNFPLKKVIPQNFDQIIQKHPLRSWLNEPKMIDNIYLLCTAERNNLCITLIKTLDTKKQIISCGSIVGLNLYIYSGSVSMHYMLFSAYYCLPLLMFLYYNKNNLPGIIQNTCALPNKLNNIVLFAQHMVLPFVNMNPFFLFLAYNHYYIMFIIFVCSYSNQNTLQYIIIPYQKTKELSSLHLLAVKDKSTVFGNEIMASIQKIKNFSLPPLLAIKEKPTVVVKNIYSKISSNITSIKCLKKKSKTKFINEEKLNAQIQNKSNKFWKIINLVSGVSSFFKSS
jgi:hypothetical protein